MIAAIVCGLVMCGLLLADQLSKAIAYALKISQPDYFLGFIRINYLPGGNTGIAWGFWGNTPTMMIAVTVLTAVMIIGIGVLFFTIFKKNTPARVCLAIIEAGAIGNFLDRICLGYVRDFVDVSPIGFNICNFADFYITFAAVALVVIILFVGKDAIIPIGKRRKRRESEECEEDEHGT